MLLYVFWTLFALGGFLVGAFFGAAIWDLLKRLGNFLLSIRWNRSIILTLLGIALLGGGFFSGLFLKDTVMPAPNKRKTLSSELSVASSLGKLMPADGLVAIVGPPGDRIVKIDVKAGDFVKKGAALVKLASHKDRSEEVALIGIQVKAAKGQKAAITAARAAKLAEIDQQVDALKATKEAETNAQTVKIKFLKKQLDAAQKQQDRIEGLDKTKVEIGAQEREQAALAVAQAKSELDAAKGVLEAAKEKNARQQQAAKAGRVSAAAEMDLALLRVPLESLEKNLALAKDRHERSTLTAPVAGTVVQIVGNAGDPTGSGPILYLAAGTGMVVIAEVYATDIHKIRAAKSLDKVKVEVKGQALGKDVMGKDIILKGRITREDAIGRSVARNGIAGFSPRSDSDRRVIEVRVQLDDRSTMIAAKFVGLEVEVTFTILE